MKSTQYFSFSKSPIDFKPTTYSATHRRIPLTATAKSLLDSIDDQSSRHVTMTRSPSKPAGSQPAARHLVVPRLERPDLSLPLLERLGSCPSLARTVRSLLTD